MVMSSFFIYGLVCGYRVVLDGPDVLPNHQTQQCDDFFIKLLIDLVLARPPVLSAARVSLIDNALFRFARQGYARTH